MSWDFTRDELFEEIEARMDEGYNATRMTDYFWSILERAYKERDTAKNGNEEKES